MFTKLKLIDVSDSKIVTLNVKNEISKRKESKQIVPVKI